MKEKATIPWATSWWPYLFHHQLLKGRQGRQVVPPTIFFQRVGGDCGTLDPTPGMPAGARGGQEMVRGGGISHLNLNLSCRSVQQDPWLQPLFPFFPPSGLFPPNSFYLNLSQLFNNLQILAHLHKLLQITNLAHIIVRFQNRGSYYVTCCLLVLFWRILWAVNLVRVSNCLAPTINHFSHSTFWKGTTLN